jgi:hypothetical protein
MFKASGQRRPARRCELSGADFDDQASPCASAAKTVSACRAAHADGLTAAKRPMDEGAREPIRAEASATETWVGMWAGIFDLEKIRTKSSA